MTRHSKNCTARPVYTYYERKKDALRSGYGTEQIRLGKDSIRGFDCCCLTLQPATDPVVTADGFLYDRAVILEYIVNQKAEIERKLKLFNKQNSRVALEEKLRAKAEKEEKAQRFLSLNTLDTHVQASVQAAEAHALASISGRGNLDGTVQKPASFWTPGVSELPKAKDALTKPDTVVRCPMSSKPLRYKNLTPVKFTTFQEDDVAIAGKQEKPNIIRELRHCCAVSKDPLTNATDCVVLRTSGSVVTKEVANNIIRKEMIDPINGKRMNDSDFIELQRGSLGFSDERTLLVAKRHRPTIQM